MKYDVILFIICAAPVFSCKLQNYSVKMSDVIGSQEEKKSESGSGAESGGGTSSDSSHEQSPDHDLIPVPPPTPKSGVSILAHKIWIGNLDKRLTE